ncbi:hypothetical protein V0R52_22455 [Pseudomonas asiatica]|uniref:hypothetical protein n=1 Tax=Pseudomonas asiatica TaxID=2219225 RepID=UPI002E7B060E|nr:hypothetical protein [Pseudomonas asiatica]MEE1919155.1 hypothetical protein [Pseudomonas asiatica]
MNLRIITAIGALCFTASVAASTSPLPAQILCTPDQHSRVGIEKLDLPGSVAHLFEYGGKVTIKKVGDRTQYSYDQPGGHDFYRLKEKTAYSKDFVDIQQDIFLYTDPNLADSSGFLILNGELQGGYFHMDWAKQRYFGFTREFGAINSYAGSCTVLK